MTLSHELAHLSIVLAIFNKYLFAATQPIVLGLGQLVGLFFTELKVNIFCMTFTEARFKFLFRIK